MCGINRARPSHVLEKASMFHTPCGFSGEGHRLSGENAMSWPPETQFGCAIRTDRSSGRTSLVRLPWRINMCLCWAFRSLIEVYPGEEQGSRLSFIARQQSQMRLNGRSNGYSHDGQSRADECGIKLRCIIIEIHIKGKQKLQWWPDSGLVYRMCTLWDGDSSLWVCRREWNSGWWTPTKMIPSAKLDIRKQWMFRSARRVIKMSDVCWSRRTQKTKGLRRCIMAIWEKLTTPQAEERLLLR